MRLARKLTLAIIVGILVIMGVTAVIRVQRESTLFQADMSRDHRFVGHALRDAVDTLWAAEGEERAALLVHATRSNQENITLRIISLDPGVPPRRQPAIRPELLTEVRYGHDFEFATERRFISYVPLYVPTPGVWALEVSEGLDEQRRYLRSSVLNNALALCAIVFVCSVLAIGLGYWFVGRPMMRLTDKARRVGAGDLTGPLVLEQHDEISEFAVEMNAMCDRLAEAHRKIELETGARIGAIEQLRHADRLRTVGQLASGIAHELGTPLNVVLGRARMIADRDTTPDETVDNAKIIADQAQRMTTLIRQLLDFARPRGPQLQSLDLRDIARATAEMLGPLGDKRRVKIVLSPVDVPVEADVDPTQIQQVLTNLVVNGMQSMNAGGTLTIEVGERVVNPPANLGGAERPFRFVRVRDQGEGIKTENLSRIFEPFFTTKQVGDGTGLGLSVAYGIVRDHGGWIDVESELGKGSTFTIYVPPTRSESMPIGSRISQGLLDGTPRGAVVRG